MEKKRRTEIAELGEFGLIDLLTRGFDPADASTLRAAGDDAAVVMPPSGEAVLCSTDALLEGIDFDLTYFPLRHLGYKAVTVAASDILAMNALPSQLMVSLGVSSKMSVEALQDLYEGIAFACREQGIDLVGGDTKASMTGLVLGLAIGYIIILARKFTINQSDSTYGADVMMGAGNASGRFLGPLIILSAMTASIPIGIGSLAGALLFYIWQKPITGGAILGAMLLGSIFPVAIS